MNYEVLGWHDEGPTLDLDWRSFSYAGKFVMTNTGKAVLKEGGEVVAAVAFNADRTDPETAWLRYITVMEDLRGEGLGARLAVLAVEDLLDRGFERIKIAVNNPFAYEALYKAGFSYTGVTTGIAELVLETPDSNAESAYLEGYREFQERDLSTAETQFVSRKLDRARPPDRLKDIR